MNEHVHVFDPVSGYCIRGCVGYRDDGRLIHKGGAILRSTIEEQGASDDTHHHDQVD